MTFFAGRMARWVAAALIFHGILVVLYHRSLYQNWFGCVNDYYAPPDIVIGLCGAGLAMIAGSGIAALSFAQVLRRVSGPFDKTSLKRFGTILAVEALVVGIFAGLILDGGVMQDFLFRITLTANLALLGFSTEGSVSDSAKEAVPRP